MAGKGGRARPIVAALALPAVFAAALLAASASQAGDLELLPDGLGLSELYASDPRSGAALGGWDPVSYQTDGAPRPGSDRFGLVWGGLGWRFASEANRQAFAADPEAFAPRLGGFDALAAAGGRIVSADPRLFTVRDGRLYLFRTEAGRAAVADAPALLVRAEAEWAAARGRFAGG